MKTIFNETTPCALPGSHTYQIPRHPPALSGEQCSGGPSETFFPKDPADDEALALALACQPVPAGRHEISKRAKPLPKPKGRPAKKRKASPEASANPPSHPTTPKSRTIKSATSPFTGTPKRKAKIRCGSKPLKQGCLNNDFKDSAKHVGSRAYHSKMKEFVLAGVPKEDAKTEARKAYAEAVASLKG